MRRLALLLGLTLVMTACGDDDDGSAPCQGYENQTVTLLGSELPSAIVFSSGNVVDPDAEYEMTVGANPLCIASVTLDGIAVAGGGLVDTTGTDTPTATGTFTSLGAPLTAGAQSASTPSSIDIDTWSAISNSATADVNTTVATAPQNIDLVFLHDGTTLSFYLPSSIPASVTNFAVFDGVVNSAVIYRISLTEPTTDSAVFQQAVAEGTEVTSIQVDDIGGGVEVFGVLTSEGKLVQIAVDTVQAPAGNATITISGWDAGIN